MPHLQKFVEKKPQHFQAVFFKQPFLAGLLDSQTMLDAVALTNLFTTWEPGTTWQWIIRITLQSWKGS